MDFFGLDIGVTSARIVRLKGQKGALKLHRIGSVPLPHPGIRADSKNQIEKLSESIKKLITDLDMTTRNVVISLPEERVTTRIKWFPPMKEKEVDSALKYEAETFIPHPLDKVQLDYQIIDKDDNGRLLVFTVGILKKEIEKYTFLAKALGLNIIALEPESISLNRIYSVDNLPTIIADINHDHTSLIANNMGNIYLTRSTSIGIKSLSRAIKINLGLKGDEAEAYREAYGLKGEELEGRVKEAMLPIVEKLIRDIKQTVLSYQKDWNEDIGLVILSGEGARTPGLAEIVAKNLGVEIQVGEPFSDVEVGGKTSVNLENKEVDFSVACGLAARGLK
jgi:type IV pilus assembly protein PilM